MTPGVLHDAAGAWPRGGLDPPLPPASLPPPPRDPVARDRQARRVRRKRITGALVIAAVMAGSVLSLWYLADVATPTGSGWAFHMTGVSALHARGLDGGGVTVCIVDTGVDPSHPDLVRVPIVAWRDFIRYRATPYDDDGHGTAMAGLIAARGAFRGVAPGVSLIVAKALDSRGMGTSAGIAAAVDFCGDPNADGDPSDGARVVSLSLAASTNLTAGAGMDVARSVSAALARGIIVIASAGNDGLADDGDVQSPASIPGVIAVGAVERFGVLARFSSMGTVAGRSDPDRKPEIVAPGVDLVTTARGGGYRLVTGTSASAAFVAGAVALLLQAHHGTTASRTATLIPSLKTAIMNAAAKEVGQVLPHDPHYGYGILDVSGVVDASW